MSIATEISRIQTATTDIKTAITDKGVIVPVGSQIDDLPALIDSIPSGGGGSPQMAYITRSTTKTFDLSNYINSKDDWFMLFFAPCTYYGSPYFKSIYINEPLFNNDTGEPIAYRGGYIAPGQQSDAVGIRAVLDAQVNSANSKNIFLNWSDILNKNLVGDNLILTIKDGVGTNAVLYYMG